MPEDIAKYRDKYRAGWDKTRQARYKTGLIGKWHLTGDYAVGRGAPEKHGWHEVIASERKYIADGDYTFP